MTHSYKDLAEEIDGTHYINELDLDARLMEEDPTLPYDQLAEKRKEILQGMAYTKAVTLTPPAVAPNRRGTYYTTIQRTDTFEWWDDMISSQWIHDDSARAYQVSFRTIRAEFYADHHGLALELESTGEFGEILMKEALSAMTRLTGLDAVYNADRGFIQTHHPADPDHMLSELRRYLTEDAIQQGRILIPALEPRLLNWLHPYHAPDGRTVNTPPYQLPSNLLSKELEEQYVQIMLDTKHTLGDYGGTPAWEKTPWEVNAGTIEHFEEAIANMPLSMTSLGESICLDQLAAEFNKLGLGFRSKTYLEDIFIYQHLAHDWAKYLVDMMAAAGYEPEAVKLTRRQFIDEVPDYWDSYSNWMYRPAPIPPAPDHTTSVGEGFSVNTPVYAIDDEMHVIVLAQCFGSQTAINALAATLSTASSKQFVFNNAIIMAATNTDYRTSGGIIHNGNRSLMNLSHRQMDPQLLQQNRPAYVVDLEMKNDIPPRFMPILDALMPIPILPGWITYLWRQGRSGKLITRVEKAAGCWAFRITQNAAQWRELIEDGIASGQLENPAYIEEE